MSRKRIQKYLPILKALSQCSNTDQKNILKSADNQLINAVCDCVTNVVYGKIPISAHHKNKLKRKKNVWRDLSNPKKSVNVKKKLLIQHGSGLLALLLKPLLSAILSI